MKLLTAIRHAKSSWRQRDLDDFERPLGERGRHDLPEMAQRFARSGPVPQLIVASPAVRAAETARGFAAAVDLDDDAVRWNRALYLASAQQVLELVRGLDDAVSHAALVGHNPGFTDLVNLLCDAAIDNLPTCAVARMRFDLDSWSSTEPACAQLLDFDFPKRTRRP